MQSPLQSAGGSASTPAHRAWWRRGWVQALPWVLVLFVLAYRVAPLRKPKGPAGGTLPELRFVTLDGGTISTGQLKGKAVVVNFWAPWCAPCRKEVPWLEKMHKNEDGKVVVLGVLADHGVDFQAREFMRSEAATYAVVRESPEIEAAFGITILPTTFYVNREGKVVHSTAGIIPEFLMRRYVQDALR